MIIKLPAGYDVSHWKEIPDFKLVTPRPALFITKATEAYPGTGWNHTDDKFERFAGGMMEIGCTRGFFHFFRKALDARRQAEHFVNVISRIDILKSDLLILDVEEGGEKTSQLWSWMEVVRAAFGDNLRLIYSRANILNPIVMTEGERAYFRKIYTWTAGYPFFPDLYTAIPRGYIPDQTKYGPAVLWQYSAHGRVEGIVGDVDLNLITPEFQAILESRKTVIGETTMALLTGKCTTQAKVWKDVGLLQVGTVQAGQQVAGDAEKIVSGEKYIRLTSPVFGWSKARWFSYSIVTTPPPEESPPTGPTRTHTVEVYSDGSLKVDGNPVA